MKTITFAAVAALVAGSAFAQDQGLGTEEAREFVMSLGEQAETAVEDGNWQGIAGWIGDHVEDGAPIQMGGEFIMSEGPTGSFQISLEGADLKQFAQMAYMGPQANMYEAVQDYQLGVSVNGAWQLPDGKVGIAATFYETGKFDMSQIEGAEGAGTGGAAMGDSIFSTMADCAMRLGGSGDSITIEAAGCDVKSML